MSQAPHDEATSGRAASPAPRTRLRARPCTRASGMLLGAALLPLGLIDELHGAFWEAGAVWQLSALALSALMLLSGALIHRRPRGGRIGASASVLGLLLLEVPGLATAPSATLVWLLAAATALALLWDVDATWRRVRVSRRPLCRGQAQGASFVFLIAWLQWSLDARPGAWVQEASIGWSLLWTLGLGVESALRVRATQTARAHWILGATLLTALAGLALDRSYFWIASAITGLVIAVAVHSRSALRRSVGHSEWWESLLGHPERLFVGTFAALCGLGTVLLALPQSSATGERIPFADAAFTAASAVCVTGLAVQDTPVAFSGLGQAILLLLIQVGGLGIMTFSTAALWALGRRMSLRYEGAMASLLSTRDRGQLYHTARNILGLTAITEAAGALALSGAFLAQGDSLGTALWRGTFTSISAFCNAGFALQSDSLVGYQNSPLILHTVAVLIMLGGLSPVVVFALPGLLRRSPSPAPAQVYLALTATGALLLSGFGAYLAFEWQASLASLSFWDKLHNAWFQSVTLRTAGFNSVDLTATRPATLTLMLIWMFIGGNAGGTAGGVKTSTVGVLLLSAISAIRGRWTLELFGKRIADRTRAKAATTVTIALLGAFVALLAVQLTQNMPTKLAVFEVISALGTVGLTIGGTARLDSVGKMVITACMFVGRVGGVTLLMFLSSRRPTPPLGRPEEEVDVG